MVGVSEGLIGADVIVSVGVSVAVGVGLKISTSTVGVAEMEVGKVGGARMNGVAVTTPGVREGIGVQTGNGWGGIPQVSHAERKMTQISKVNTPFFIRLLYLWILRDRLGKSVI